MELFLSYFRNLSPIRSSAVEHEVIFAAIYLCRKCPEMVVFINGDSLTFCVQSITCREINNITGEGPLLQLCLTQLNWFQALMLHSHWAGCAFKNTHGFMNAHLPVMFTHWTSRMWQEEDFSSFVFLLFTSACLPPMNGRSLVQKVRFGSNG